MAQQSEQSTVEEDVLPWERKENRVILIPVDGSKHSDRAFEWYKTCMMQKGDTLIMFTGFELPAMQAAYHNDPDSHLEGFRLALQKNQSQARAVLQPYDLKCQELKEILGRIKIISEGGNKAAQLVCKCVSDEKVDMVIIGSRGLGKIRRTVLGSVSDYIVHHANVPVIIVPPDM